MSNDSLIVKAAQFAEYHHRGQVRDYTNRPYITHPIRVAGRVATHPEANADLVAAAFLHDVVEDCGVTINEIYREFNQQIADYVSQLTNTSKDTDLPRSERKKADRRRIANICRRAKIVKLIDRIDNLGEMDPRDIKCCHLYCEESQLLLDESLQCGEQGLQLELQEAINKLRNDCKQYP